MQALNNEQEEVDNNINLSPDGCTEKVLEIWWVLESDEYQFSFKFNKGNREVLHGNGVPTKIEIYKY